MWSRVASAAGCGLCFGSQAEQFSITVAQSVQLVLVRFISLLRQKSTVRVDHAPQEAQHP